MLPYSSEIFICSAISRELKAPKGHITLNVSLLLLSRPTGDVKSALTWTGTEWNDNNSKLCCVKQYLVKAPPRRRPEVHTAKAESV